MQRTKRTKHNIKFFPSPTHLLLLQTCCECGEDLEFCPICRSTINTRIKLY